MIDMNSPLPLDRNSMPAMSPAEMLRSPTVENPVAAPVARQAETQPGVEVQISSAAREAVARDPLPTVAGPTEAARIAAAAANDELASAAAAPQATTQPAAAQEPAASTQNRAMQMFTETAGIGLEQANPSPLRDIA